MVKQLVEEGADPARARKKDQLHCLPQAIQSGNEEVVQYLLGLGASPLSLDLETSDTCLALAIHQYPEKTDLVALLLEAGADPSISFGNRRSLPGFDKHVFYMEEKYNICHWLVHEDRQLVDLSDLAKVFVARCPQLIFSYGCKIFSNSIQSSESSLNTETPLQLACWYHEHTEDPTRKANLRNMVRTYIELGADIHQPLPDSTLLSGDLTKVDDIFRWLCNAPSNDETSKMELLELLFQKGAIVDKLSSKKRRTALHDACRQNRFELATALLNHGASPTLLDEKGKSCLHLTTSIKMLELILARGTPIDLLDARGHSVLHRTIETTDNVDLLAFFLDRGASLEAKTIESEATPLHRACFVSGRLDQVEFLLERGADLEARTVDENTPLWLANMQGFFDVVVHLLAHGADEHVSDKKGSDVLTVAVRNGHETLVALWLQRKHDPEKLNAQGLTALHVASTSKQVSLDVVEILLKHGVNVEARTKSGRTPLHNACNLAPDQPILPLVQLLVEHKANVSARDQDGNTPLHLLCSQAGPDVFPFQAVVRLVKEGADLMTFNFHGKTPRDHCIACGIGDSGVTRILKEAAKSDA